MGRPLDEKDLVEQAKRGDAAAYGALIRMHQEIAFRTAYALLRDGTEAEEAVQDAFVKAHRALGRFRSAAPFRPWLLRIVGNEARNRARSRGRRERLAQRAASAQAVSGGAAPPPEADVVEEEERRALFAALDRLPPDERLAVIGRFFLGLTDAEAAAALGVRRGAIKMRVFRALEHLRRELGEAEL